MLLTIRTNMSNEKNIIIYLLCYISILNIQGILTQQEGESCTSGGFPGICRLLNDCPTAIEAIQRGQNPVICSFPTGSQVPVVCCVDSALLNSRSFRKCVEYSQYVYEWVDPPTQVTGNRVRVNRCAQVVEPLVVGGTPALPREFSHMTALGFADGLTIVWICGGTLISERFVLTAGHCTTHQQYGDVQRIRVGDLNLVRTDDVAVPPQEFLVAEIIPHPEYLRPSRYNDIALLRIAGTVVLSSFVIPACLRYDPIITETRALAAGWGRTSFNGDNSNDLLKVTLELFTQEDCNASYVPVMSDRQLRYGILPETQLCAGHHSEEKDVCQGDSGGPLQVYQHDGIYCMYSIIGVTSFGSGCGIIGAPGVYTRVSAYIPWIESIVFP